MRAEYLTIGDIARQLGVARTRLDYAIQKIGLRERGRAGILRLYGSDQIPAMKAALGTVRVRRSPSTGPDRPEEDHGG